MASDKKEALSKSNFGSRVAEDELQSLGHYFVETEQWRKLYAGHVDIVFGEKGSGKSALYSLLVAKREALRLGRRTIFIAAENPRGAPVFRDLATDPPATEEQFRAMWKLYFLCLATEYLRFYLQTNKLGNTDAALVIAALTDNELLPKTGNLLAKLKAITKYLHKHAPVFEGSVIEPTTGIKLTGKITLREPSAEQSARGFMSVDSLLDTLNKAYKACEIKVWLVLDRLDVAFADSLELETNALRALFRTYLDMVSLSHIDVKILARLGTRREPRTVVDPLSLVARRIQS